jgi:FkbM family methyltransferase
MLELARVLRFIVSQPLNRASSTSALLRFVRWQLASRIMRQPIALPYIDDTVLLAETGTHSVTQNWYCGLYDPSGMGFLLHALQPQDLLVDVGANVGAHVVLAAGGAGANVICVEPIPSSFKRLETNIRLNGIEKVEAHLCGLSSSSGTLRFTTDADTVNRVAESEELENTIAVPVKTLDQLIGERKPRFIKLDAQGHEVAVISGGTKVLADSGLDAVLTRSHRTDASFSEHDVEVSERLQAFGFQPFVYDPIKREFARRGGYSRTTVFARNIAELQAQCRTARRYRLVTGTI